ncbi:SWF or SNF family helicase [Streptomyces sp. TRM49041]|uniref:SWF or SNF family helicase n=1 Tax=Streptomyces sp. TRM49041 TaxID=2603216 RepID=UPI0011F019D9|nr:SWF or SNF family helicase [Streptomyces sp. TRM49041]
MSGAYHEDESTFAALPPARGRGFAETWWGRAWLKALEDTALDGEQLKKGRARARAGAVGAVTVRPGRITAVVQDRDGTAYRADVLVQELSDGDWDRFLETAVERAGHVAALLDRDMPPHLVEDAAAAGVELLPGMGDLDAECACGAWDHCPHTAALSYQVARLLDRDPFVLLLVRGRGERRVLEELTARGAAAADEVVVAEPEGVRADEAFAVGGILPALPVPPPVPAEPGEPPSLDTEAGPAEGVHPAALELLAADAAGRARRMLAEALATGGAWLPDEALTPGQDAVRLAAVAGDAPEVVARLAAGTGRGSVDLELAVRAWRLGGAAGLAVLEEEWAPEPDVSARAEALLAGAWEDGERPALRSVGGGRWDVPGADVQVRLGRDGRWWPYRRERGRWAPAGPCGHEPGAVLAGLLEEGEG